MVSPNISFIIVVQRNTTFPSVNVAFRKKKEGDRTSRTLLREPFSRSGKQRKRRYFIGLTIVSLGRYWNIRSPTLSSGRRNWQLVGNPCLFLFFVLSYFGIQKCTSNDRRFSYLQDEGNCVGTVFEWPVNCPSLPFCE